MIAHMECSFAFHFDRHHPAMDAPEAGDADALRAAIAAEIADGIGQIGRSRLETRAEARLDVS